MSRDYPIEVLRRTPSIKCVHKFTQMEMSHSSIDFEGYVKDKLARQIGDFIAKDKPSAFSEREDNFPPGKEIRLEAYVFTTEEFRSILDDVYQQGKIDSLRESLDLVSAFGRKPSE